MELAGASIDLYVRHAFTGMGKVLDRLGPTVTDHPWRDFLPGADRSDGALVLHVRAAIEFAALRERRLATG